MGYAVGSVERDNVGWDLNAVNAVRELRLEVKGLSGSDAVVDLTPNECRAMRQHRDSYRVCVVTNALTDPRLEVFSSSRETDRWESPAGQVPAIEEIVAARYSAGGPMKYWQIAAGSDSRDYSRDFLQYSLAFVGGSHRIAAMQQVELGDRLILKRGVSQILAAGVVVDREASFAGTPARTARPATG